MPVRLQLMTTWLNALGACDGVAVGAATDTPPISDAHREVSSSHQRGLEFELPASFRMPPPPTSLSYVVPVTPESDLQRFADALMSIVLSCSAAARHPSGVLHQAQLVVVCDGCTTLTLQVRAVVVERSAT